MSGIKFPNCVGESAYQGAKDVLKLLKAERERVAQRQVADEARWRPARDPPSEPPSRESVHLEIELKTHQYTSRLSSYDLDVA
jgi:hypothetical protein